MKTFAATAALASLFATTAEARMWLGECPSIEWNTGFDAAAFAGQWYEQERDAAFTFEMDQMCSTGNYELNSEGTLDVQWRAMVPMNFYQYGSSPPGKMDCSESFNCQVSMAESEKTVSWGMIGTDYDNWHVTYWCGMMMGMQYSWLAIYGKEQKLSDAYMAEAKAAIEDKLPGCQMGWPWMKESVQGDFFGGSCQYEW